jgi:hypothetical protein
MAPPEEPNEDAFISIKKEASMKRILDPSFRYRPSFNTDIRKTFAELRRGTHEANDRSQPDGKVTPIRTLPGKGSVAG